MLELVKGCTVHNPETLLEGYKTVDDNILLASVKASKIQDVFGHFIVMHENEQMFFILELPTSLDNETTGSDNVVNAFHVCFNYLVILY